MKYVFRQTYPNQFLCISVQNLSLFTFEFREIVRKLGHKMSST